MFNDTPKQGFDGLGTSQLMPSQQSPLSTPVKDNTDWLTNDQKRATMFEQVNALTYQAKEFTQEIRQQLAQETLNNPYLKYQNPLVIQSELGINQNLLTGYTEENTYIDSMNKTLARATEFKGMDWGKKVYKGTMTRPWDFESYWNKFTPGTYGWEETGENDQYGTPLYALWYQIPTMNFSDYVKSVSEYSKSIQEKVKQGYYFEETDPAIISLNDALKRINYINTHMEDWTGYDQSDYWQKSWLNKAITDVQRRQYEFIRNVMTSEQFDNITFGGYGDYAHYAEGTVIPDQYSNPDSPYYTGAQPSAIMSTISTFIRDWALSFTNMGIGNWQDLLNKDKLIPALIGLTPTVAKSQGAKVNTGQRLQQGSLGKGYDLYQTVSGLDKATGSVASQWISKTTNNLLDIMFRRE